MKRLEFRFLPGGAKFRNGQEEEEEKIFSKIKDNNLKEEEENFIVNKYPAVVVPVENSNGEIVAVQRIILNPKTGKKPKYFARYLETNNNSTSKWTFIKFFFLLGTNSPKVF